MKTGSKFRFVDNTREARDAVNAGAVRGLNRVAVQWHAAARQMVPVDTGRLRASIAFATPTTAPAVTYEDDGGVLRAFQPRVTEGLTVEVGTNVQYASAVHEGISAGPKRVAAHTRRIDTAFGRSITPMTVNVRAHTRVVRARAPVQFISAPLRERSSEWRALIAREVREATS